tara:strand:+ start:48 stop:1496 length:1449 start_codon:yes stop_codon:yes gene_type:complete
MFYWWVFVMNDNRFDWFARLGADFVPDFVAQLVDSAVESYSESEKSGKGVNLHARNAAFYEIASQIVSALYQSQTPLADGMYKVSVPKGAGNYNQGLDGELDAKKIRFSFRYVTQVLECLKQLGWVKVTEHVINKHHTLIAPYGKLAREFKRIGYVWHPSAPKPEVLLVELKDVVRDKNGKAKRNKKGKTKKISLKVKSTEATISKRSALYTINTNLVQHCYSLDLNDAELEKFEAKQAIKLKVDYKCVDFFQIQLYRIFSRGSYEKGGRFYRGWWQNILSDYRKHILIDGVRTVEVDYCNMSIRMLYAKIDHEYPIGLDAYSLGLPNWEGKQDPRRKIIKQFINALLNDEDGVYKLKKKDVQILGLDHEQMLALVKKVHGPIFDLITAGGGQGIQYEDSQITQDIILELLNDNITCLPVHDSFIVQHQHADSLVAVMKSVFKKRLGVYGVVDMVEGHRNIQIDSDSVMGKFLQAWKDHDFL